MNSILRLCTKIFFLKNSDSISRIRSYIFFKNPNSFVHTGFILNGNSSKVILGKNVRFYPNSILEITRNAHLEIGDNSVFSYGSFWLYN